MSVDLVHPAVEKVTLVLERHKVRQAARAKGQGQVSPLA
jgi:hypothetical protein